MCTFFFLGLNAVSVDLSIVHPYEYLAAASSHLGIPRLHSCLSKVIPTDLPYPSLPGDHGHSAAEIFRANLQQSASENDNLDLTPQVQV